MRKILLAIFLMFPFGASAISLETVKAQHMQNCLTNGGLKEICACSFDESLKLMSLKDLAKYNELIEAGYTADIKTTARLARATMDCNSKLRTNEEFLNKTAQDQGLLPPPPPPPMLGSVGNKPEPLPNQGDVNINANKDKTFIADAKNQSPKPEVPPEKEKIVTPKPAPQKKSTAKPKPSIDRGYGEYDEMFFEAAKKGDLTGLRAYGEIIHDINVKNESGDTALIAATRFEQIVSVKFLLANGADPQIANPKGQTALHVATYAKRVDMVELLLRAGADINASYSKGFTPLVLAVMQQDYPMVKTLLAKKASVNMPRVDGNNELHIAVTGPNVEIVQQLVKAGVDKNKLNKVGNTPLMVAAYRGNARAAQALLNLGADANITDQYGRTALSLANSAGKQQVVNLLLSYKVKR